MNTYDIVIIGAGSAGCVLSNRLSEDESLSVLLIEAGGTDKHPFVRVPAASGKAIFNPRFNWMYMAEHDPSRNLPQPEMWPAGKALGGGGSINGMMFVRGHRYDYDNWADLGATGWAYDDVLPYFKKLETNERGADDYRGGNGPLSVSEVRAPSPLTKRWLEAAQNIGIKRCDDLNGADAEGVDYVQSSQKNGKRHSASAAYLWPVVARKNLTVWTNTSVVKVNFNGNVATGVSASKGNEIIEITAQRGVVLTAGSLATPKIMKMSGVGPANELEALNIPVVASISGVGKNLQEHPGVPMGHHVSSPSIGSKGNLFVDAVKNVFYGINYLLRGRGPLSCGVGHAQAMVRTSDKYDVPNAQIIMSPFSFEVDEKGPRLYDKPAIGVAVGLTRTEARGSVSLRSADWRDPPKIEYEMLSSQHDVEQLIDACKMAREITRAAPFNEVLKDDRAPDESIQSDEEWEAFVRANAFPMYHPCGTCAMGNDSDSVVDPLCRVHGTEKFWVADASVFPRVTAGNINATVIMVAEKAADHIKQALQETQKIKDVA